MALFIVFAYLKSWFTSTYLYSAASADLDLCGRIKQFSKLHKKIAEVGEAVLQRHTWYLTEELIPLSLFDAKLPEDTANRLAEKIGQLPESDLKVKKPTLPKDLSQLGNTRLRWTEVYSIIQVYWSQAHILGFTMAGGTTLSTRK